MNQRINPEFPHQFNRAPAAKNRDMLLFPEAPEGNCCALPKKQHVHLFPPAPVQPRGDGVESCL
ncbi:MAG TPA: hypothetical protein VFX89_14030, partial [Gammaproteobacteria bacterium]|nr:hypothetical protein [Gammaproteobacteria bacterium]